MRIKIKNIIAHILYYTGIILFLERILLKNRCVVLVYHRIVDPDKEIAPVQDGMYVTPELFEKHIKYLNRHFNLISIDELISTIKGEKKYCRSCHITFDDGWRDNYTNAFPLLKKYNVPATIFLATDFIGTTRWFWPERLLFLLADTKSSEIGNCNYILTEEILKMFHEKNAAYEDRINSVINFLKNKSEESLESVIQDLKKITGNTTLPKKRLLLDWSEVKKMAEHGIIFGSHTKSHAILTNFKDVKKINVELAESKIKIEDKTGNNSQCFCFPNGNWNPHLIKLVKNNGYKCAFIGESGSIDGKCDLFKLKRIGIHNDVSFNMPFFASRLLFKFF